MTLREEYRDPSLRLRLRTIKRVPHLREAKVGLQDFNAATKMFGQGTQPAPKKRKGIV
jgi:hypothetical protein